MPSNCFTFSISVSCQINFVSFFRFFLLPFVFICFHIFTFFYPSFYIISVPIPSFFCTMFGPSIFCNTCFFFILQLSHYISLSLSIYFVSLKKQSASRTKVAPL